MILLLCWRTRRFSDLGGPALLLQQPLDRVIDDREYPEKNSTNHAKHGANSTCTKPGAYVGICWLGQCDKRK